MVTGDTGHNGLAAPKPVDQGQEAGQGSVTTQLQLMEAETVKNQAVGQKFVTQTTVQVKPFIKCLQSSTSPNDCPCPLPSFNSAFPSKHCEVLVSSSNRL